MNGYNTCTLADGLRIIHCQQQGDVVYCGYAIKAGSRNESMAEEGLAHFCEHLSFKGTVHLSSLQIINSLERVGGELNAFTAKEETMYYASILKQYFYRAVDTLTDMVFCSTYPQAEIEKECEVVCDEIDSYRDSPAELIYDDFENHLFSGHPLGHNVLGTKDSVRSYTTEDCRRFTSRLYRPQNAVFYVLGDINFSALVKRLERLHSTFRPSSDGCETEGKSRSLSSLLEERATSVDSGIIVPASSFCIDETQETHQGHVMTGVAFAHNLERWRVPLFLFNNILAGPVMNSRLNLALRERRGLVYTVEGIMTSYTDAILWSVYYGCDKEEILRCQRLVNSQIERFRRAPLSEAVLRACKTQLCGQIALAAQQQENFAIDMAKQYLHRGTLRSIPHLYERIGSVTAEEIHTLANMIVNKDNLFTLVYK